MSEQSYPISREKPELNPQKYSDTDNSYNKQPQNYKQTYQYNYFLNFFSKNQNHDRQSNINYSHNYNTYRQSNSKYPQKQRDYYYQAQPDPISQSQKPLKQSETEKDSQQTNKDLFQQANQDAQFQNQIQIGGQSNQNQQLNDIKPSTQVSNDKQELSTQQINGPQSQESASKEIQKPQFNEKVQTIANANSESTATIQHNKQLLGISQQQLIQQKQIPLLVQFLILPNDTTSQPQLIPLTLQNLTQTYEQLKLLIQNDDQQQS
ncbi:unnamed protein product (macronuclear) [Paramecium tetraurelia]|uniref:Uncharacterized protein n=1 Tax=Paramecium tetraurelia TaxID=5888 RepID=A0BSE7_PARTE|nr:uncharacterized protein GSPATT00031695001 [Paramecium tetraurelia]CAK61464.1 unnamed protein product [Paramecium tetraurelia]|eukprot:XP_001428862.1 hypothetical protein (macronuclear) [Paramecium tetraurelia strain d4-2]